MCSCFLCAVQALCLLSRNNASVFQNVLDKVGLPKVLASLSVPVVKIQQAVITMFIILVTSESCTCHFLQDKVVNHILVYLPFYTAFLMYG